MNEENLNSIPNNDAQNTTDSSNTIIQPPVTMTVINHDNETITGIVQNFQSFGLASLLYAIFFCFCLYQNFAAVTSPLICVATVAYFLFCFKKLAIKTKKSMYFYCISICLLGLSNMLTHSWILIFLNYVGIILLLFCFLLQHFYETEKWDFGKYSGALLQTIFCSISRINYPFKSFGLFYKSHQKNKNSKSHFVWVGIIISIPLLIIVCSLLLSADVVFRNLTDSLFSNLFGGVDFFNLFGMAVFVFIGLVGSYCVLIELSGKHINETMENRKTMEPIIAITFTSILTVIYLCFSVIQIVYLFIGNMELPYGYTYARYAREGFFQLLFVCLLNLVLALFCMKHYEDNRILKIILTVICGCTYIMIASSTMRMLLYIQTYYLTFLRVFVLVALFVLFLCLTGVVISIYREKFPLFQFMLSVVTICYLLLSLSRPDYFIASYNIGENAASADDYYLFELSLDAVPAMEKSGYLEANKEVITAPGMDSSSYYYNLQTCADYIRHENRQMNLRKFNLSVYQAGKIMEKYEK